MFEASRSPLSALQPCEAAIAPRSNATLDLTILHRRSILAERRNSSFYRKAEINDRHFARILTSKGKVARNSVTVWLILGKTWAAEFSCSGGCSNLFRTNNDTIIGVGSTLETLRHGIGRHQRRAFWEATIAVCAFVAAPDGKVSFATRVRIDNILDSLPDLRVFDTSEFVELFDRFVEEFRVSPRKARVRALDVIRKGGTSDREEAELLMRIALAVADVEAGSGKVELAPLQAVSGELGVDLKTMLDIGQDIETERAAAPAVANVQPSAGPNGTADKREDEPPMPDEESTATPAPTVAATSPAPSAAAPAPESKAELSQQLQVDGTKGVIALCGHTKSGAKEALRIYENEQLAAADCALSEKIAKQKFWLSPVTLFPSPGSNASSADGEPTPIHVMCLSRPDGSVEALRAFENADQASADLEFFRNITNDKMWVSVVQFKTVS